MVFDRSCPGSFFSLPQWYDLLARFGVPSGTEIRVYTDERPGSMVAVPLQVSTEAGHRSLASLSNFYSVEHAAIAARDAELDRGLPAILPAVQRERPPWDCLRFAELDPRDASYDALVRALRRAGLFVECTVGSATWYETTE